MGWFSSSKEPPSNESDPLHDLTPELRDFLEKESPVKYETSAPPFPSTSPEPTQTPSETPSSPSVPPQSLFKDGRYADLWATYKPLREIEDSCKSDQDRIFDVLDAYKARKSNIARIALENCSIQHSAISECFTSGGWKKRMTMCRAENKAFERCYVMQNRFLRALGYLSSYNHPAALDEDIQMHADKLYQRMLEQEKAIEAAKEAGEPIPSFPPLITKSDMPAARSKPHTPYLKASPPPLPSADESAAASDSTPEESNLEIGDKKGITLTDEARKELQERLKNETQLAKEVAERAVQAEVESDDEVRDQVNELRSLQKQGRKERREKGEASVGDIISGWLGW